MVSLKKQNKQTKQYSKFQIRQIPMKFTFPKDAFLDYETHTGEEIKVQFQHTTYEDLMQCSLMQSCIVLRAFRKMCLLWGLQ